MRSRLIYVCLLLFCAGLSHAGNELNGKALPATTQEWMDHLSNPRLFSLSVRDPTAYAALMDAASDPRFLASAMLAGANPQTYMSFLQGLRDPETLRKGLLLMTSQTAMDWAYSSVDPEFQNALLSRATVPQIADRSMDAMRDPAYFQSAVAVFDAPVQWMKVEAYVHIAQPSVIWSDPKTCKGWMRLMAQPLSTDAKKSGYPSTKPKPLLFLSPPQRY